MNNIIIKKSQLAQAVLGASINALDTFNFQEVPEIAQNNIILYGIEAFTAEQMEVSPIDGSDVIAANGAPQIAVTLVAPGGKHEVELMPFYNMIRSLNGGYVILFEGIRLNLTSCFITLGAVSNLNAGESVPFNLYYDFVK